LRPQSCRSKSLRARRSPPTLLEPSAAAIAFEQPEFAGAAALWILLALLIVFFIGADVSKCCPLFAKRAAKALTQINEGRLGAP
jgi:hypothetical protein